MNLRSIDSRIARGAFFALVVGFVLCLIWRDTHPAKAVLPPLMRLESVSDDMDALEIPIVHYEGIDGANAIRVDFIGAVHMAEGTYYQGLNRRFTQYDAVLFELIADPGKIEHLSGARHDSTLGMIQRKMADFLGLRFQLDDINYRAPNFVHADMTPDELQKAMQQRGETLPKMILKLLSLSFDPKLQRSLETSGFSADELNSINPIMVALRGPTPEERAVFKRFMAHGLMVSDQVLKELEGGTGSVIIADRNKTALAVLKREISSGKRNVAIFYGVGHLPDMHKKLTEEFGLTLTGVEWASAWNVEKRKH